jgi:hypothetical protein
MMAASRYSFNPMSLVTFEMVYEMLIDEINYSEPSASV